MSTRLPATAGRLVVAFDPHTPSSAALELALRLAIGRVPPLHGLYVEDTDALTLGAFPWAREITIATAESRPLHTAAIERHYRGGAAAARALFEAAVPRLPGARFEAVRGRLAEELTRIASDAAGVLMDWPAASRRNRHRAGAVIRALLELPVPLVGLVEPRARAAATILVVAGNDEGAEGARALAERLAAPAKARVRVSADRRTAAAIVALARAEAAGTVLVQRDVAAGDEGMLAELASEWSGSLLLLR